MAASKRWKSEIVVDVCDNGTVLRRPFIFFITYIILYNLRREFYTEIDFIINYFQSNIKTAGKY